MTETAMFVGLVCGIFLGVVAFWVLTTPSVPYAAWLGKRCWVRPAGRAVYSEHVVVAVSWHGAVCVRRADRMDEDGYWIKKQNVRWRVLWCAPREGE